MPPRTDILLMTVAVAAVSTSGPLTVSSPVPAASYEDPYGRPYQPQGRGY